MHFFAPLLGTELACTKRSTAQVIQLLQGMAEKGKKEKHEEQVPP